MKILSFESSCDETAASVVENGRTVLADIIYSQADMHAIFGGVVPEIASRKHAEKISLVAEKALQAAGLSLSDIDAVAATCAPGLIGALLVGANFAKATSLALNIPFIPVHHIRGHIAANYLAFPQLTPPFTAIVASGGHTLIADVSDYTHMEIIGTTRDDAAGEAFDKIARTLSLPYPGGKAMDQLSQSGDPSFYKLPRAVVGGAPYDFSFSGLKSAALNIIHNAQQKGDTVNHNHLAAAVSLAVAEAIAPKGVSAALERSRKTLVAAGGVAANSTLRGLLASLCAQHGIALYIPPLELCGDNGAMIGSQAYYEYLAGNISNEGQNCFATMPVSESFAPLSQNLSQAISPLAK